MVTQIGAVKRPPGGRGFGKVCGTAVRTGRVAATSEPRDRRSCKTAPQPYGIGVGDEYADGDRQTQMMTSRLTGDR
jgi:hypothetical protein